MSRPALHPQLKNLQNGFVEVFEALRQAGHPNWYPSLWVERRSWMKFFVNDREETCNESFKEGVVLRIFDGTTLHEEACDDWDPSVLKQRVLDLVDRVKRTGQQPSQKAYVTPSWADRLKLKLESDITDQIPKDVSRDKWVHFSTDCRKALWDHKDDGMNYTKDVFKRIKDRSEALSSDDVAKNPDFTQTQMRLERDDFIYIDCEVRMSQTVLRNMTAGMVMKGGENGRMYVGGVGGRETVEYTEDHIKDSYDQLRNLINAERLTPGRYKLLMHPSVTGVFAHEAFGHSQEGDTWARGRSKAKDLFEQQTKVGNEHASIVNNPAVYHNGADGFAAWGSYFFDEEGWLAQKHYLVKEGVLQNPMTNLTSALRLDLPRTANGKRESWTNGMYTRQTNTYFTEGDQTLDQMMAMVDDGYLASNSAGGMEDPKGMGIQVGIQYLQEIKNGKLTGRTFVGPNGGSVQMTGYVPDYLNSIVAKSKIDHFDDSKDESRHPWNEVGGCGKYHKELVNAGCGGPYMLIENVLLG